MSARGRLRGALVAALLLLFPVEGAPQTALDQVRAPLARLHEDPAGVDRARDTLEALLRQAPEAKATPAATAEMLTLLARIHFLDGDLRATSPDARLAAYERGREAGKRAVELAPDSAQAHLWFALNSGRWAEANGILKSLALLPTLRREAELILKLDPRLPEGHSLAGSLAANLPTLLGGDKARAERHFLEAMRLAPNLTGTRVELAKFYIATGRHAEARTELQRVVDERDPKNPAHWTLRDRPRAVELLRSLPEATN